MCTSASGAPERRDRQDQILAERRQLIAQTSLELLHVGTVKGLPAAGMRRPLSVSFLDRLIGECRHAVHAFTQVPRSVPSTA